jgi:hypothetical protein
LSETGVVIVPYTTDKTDSKFKRYRETGKLMA